MKNLMNRGIILALILGFMFFTVIALQAGVFSEATEKKININTATASELQKLPRIGAKVAQRIVDFRTEHGNFKKIEDIMKVKGIGEKTFKRIRDRITVGNNKKTK